MNDEYKATKFDNKDMEALVEGISTVEHIKIKNAPIDDDTLEIILKGLQRLRKLTLIGCDGLVNYRLKKGLSKSNKIMTSTDGFSEEKNEGLTNRIFQIIANECKNLTHLKVGGEPMNFNTIFNKKGIKELVNGESL